VDDGTVVFRVADTGIGIAPEDRERIFRDFAQVESHLQRRARGSGLGLPLSRKLAVLLGGDLGVESTPGAGSVFSLVVPVTYTEPAAAEQQG
jgi:signal transduction histidine kinase